MKLVHVMPVFDGGPTLKTLLKQTEKKLRGKHTTFIRQRANRFVHAQYRGWITWCLETGGVLAAVVRSRKSEGEWQLLSSFIGYLERHMAAHIRSITITHVSEPQGAGLARMGGKKRSIRRPLPNVKRRLSKMALANLRRMKRVLQKREIRINRPSALRFRNAEYVFTGRFDVGYQRECMDQVKKRGASVSLNVTRNTEVVVIGSQGSPVYLWKTYGKKIEKADHYRSASSSKTPLIIMEDTWLRLM